MQNSKTPVVGLEFEHRRPDSKARTPECSQLVDNMVTELFPHLPGPEPGPECGKQRAEGASPSAPSLGTHWGEEITRA